MSERNTTWAFTSSFGVTTWNFQVRLWPYKITAFTYCGSLESGLNFSVSLQFGNHSDCKCWMPWLPWLSMIPLNHRIRHQVALNSEPRHRSPNLHDNERSQQWAAAHVYIPVFLRQSGENNDNNNNNKNSFFLVPHHIGLNLFDFLHFFGFFCWSFNLQPLETQWHKPRIFHAFLSPTCTNYDYVCHN